MTNGKNYYRYSKDKKILSSAPMRALENKIKSGTHVGAKTMALFAKREYEENASAIEESRKEQEMLRAKKRARIGFRRGYSPYKTFRTP